MCVDVSAWKVRDTGALLSPSHGTGEYQPRGEHDCSGGTLLGETIIVGCVSPALLRPPRNTNNHEDFRFWTCFSSSAHTTKAQTKLRKPQLTVVSTYRKNSRAAFNRPCTEKQSTTVYVRVDQSETTQASTHERASQVLPRASHVRVFYVFFSSFFLCYSVFVYTFGSK